MNWNLFHCLIRVKQLITTLTFLQERKLTPALSQHFEMAGGQASAFFSTHRKSRHNGPLSFPEWVNLSEARLVHTHLTCPWVFPGSWVPVSWLPLTFSLTTKALKQPLFCPFLSLLWQSHHGSYLPTHMIGRTYYYYCQLFCLQIRRVCLNLYGRKSVSNPVFLMIKWNHEFSFTIGF